MITTMHTDADSVFSMRNPLWLNLPKTDVEGENYTGTVMEINEKVAAREIGSSKVCEHQRKLEQLLLTAR
jgi:hypothetical protein